MSVITSIIIIFPYSELETERIQEINSFQFGGKTFSFKWIDDDKNGCYNGNKNFNSVVLLGSYNNFPLESFLEYIRSNVKWDDKTYVQILIKSESTNDATFKIYENAGERLSMDSQKW